MLLVVSGSQIGSEIGWRSGRIRSISQGFRTVAYTAKMQDRWRPESSKLEL